MTEQERMDWYAAVQARANQEGTYAVDGGMRIEELGDGWARGALRLAPRHANPMGIVHGGVYCTMMDQVAGTAACTGGGVGARLIGPRQHRFIQRLFFLFCHWSFPSVKGVISPSTTKR